jgi:uncharacterized Tic20 family protein
MEPTEVIPPTPDERTIAMLAHLMQIFAWFWGPLVVYLVKRESRFVAFHALQALFLQIILYGFVVCWDGCLDGVHVWFRHPSWRLAPQLAGSPYGAPHSFSCHLGLMMCGWILNITLGIIFGIKASKGEWAQYPILGRWARRLAG